MFPMGLKMNGMLVLKYSDPSAATRGVEAMPTTVVILLTSP